MTKDQEIILVSLLLDFKHDKTDLNSVIYYIESVLEEK